MPPLGPRRGRHADPAESIGRGELAPVWVHVLVGHNEVLGQQTGDAAAHRTAAETGAAIKSLSVGAMDAMYELLKGDSIVLFLEAEGATNDVEQDLEFRFVEIGHHVIQDNVGHLRVSRLGETWKLVVVEARLTGHRPPRG